MHRAGRVKLFTHIVCLYSNCLHLLCFLVFFLFCFVLITCYCFGTKNVDLKLSRISCNYDLLIILLLLLLLLIIIICNEVRGKKLFEDDCFFLFGFWSFPNDHLSPVPLPLRRFLAYPRFLVHHQDQDLCKFRTLVGAGLTLDSHQTWFSSKKDI